MLSELDECDERCHEEFQSYIAKARITRILTTGSKMASFSKGLGITTEEFQSNIALQSRFQAMTRAGDLALVMGGKSSGFPSLVAALIAQVETGDGSLKMAAE